MDVTAVVRNIPALVSAYQTELMALYNKHINEEQFNEISCHDKDLLYWYGAFYQASIIKKALDRNSNIDWKSDYNYVAHKECLRCKDIDYDAILTSLSISLI